MRGKHRTRSAGTRVAVTAIGSAVVAAAALIAPTGAGAWPWDPKVIVKGGAGCNTTGSLATFVTFGLNNGETASSPFYSDPSTHLGYYKVTFTSIPSYGATGYAVVTCSSVVDGSSYQYTKAVGINRPNFGEVLALNLKSG